MRFLLLSAIALSTFIYILSQLSYGQPLEGFTVTDNQISFAQSLPSQIPGVISAKWQSPMDIWVEADGADQSRAKDIALDVIFEGKNILNQSFCVHVHNGNWQQIAMTCWSSP
ncbi:MAG: hypothetical protein HY693_01070 [Deltaproteobacteria bacterium]|nr:hypothetical protein [Deltaproteobacteria bacterium]